MIPYPHQLTLSDKAFKVLADYMIVYLAMEERTGKTLTSILICEKAKVQNILVVTKKKALEGWHDTLSAFDHTKNYTVVNYHQAKKENPKVFDLVILDESHSYISSFPKRSAMWKDISRLTKGKPLIYLSATPYAQGAQLLFNQLALSDWSPFNKWSSPYAWFRAFGIPDSIYLSGRAVETYKKVRTEEVLSYCSRLFITATRRELKFEHEPTDKLHFIGLDPSTKDAYNLLMKHRVIELNGAELLCDTPMKLRTSLHMLEGGVAKIDDTYMLLGNDEKIRYIKEHWPDTKATVIMYNYVAEGEKLRQHFKQATLLQATSFAEGVDLSGHDDLLIYSQDFSTARHSQRRARQANKKRDTPITVHFLLVEKAVSEQVYKTVSINKTNFVDSVFTREEL